MHGEWPCEADRRKHKPGCWQPSPVSELHHWDSSREASQGIGSTLASSEHRPQAFRSDRALAAAPNQTVNRFTSIGLFLGSHGLPFMGFGLHVVTHSFLLIYQRTNENPAHPFYLCTSFRRECPLRSHLPAAGVLTPSAGWQQPEGNGGNFNLPQSHLTPCNESSLACCTFLYQSARLRLRIALAHL